MASCASCLRPLPDGARFCPSCGEEVVVVASEERRVVTVVFADLVGYTAMSEHLDPERVKRLIDAAFARLIADINLFGGRVDKVLGDGILAMFGAPVAHEDDADRAIRAAMQMHETLSRFVAEQSEFDVPLRLRVGVNTGEVLVGTVSGTTDYTAMGDVVNVASRLQALAPPDGIYIGDSTAALASDEIVRELVDDVDVRGREQTERVWRITGRETRKSVLGSRADLPFVGRTMQRELVGSVMAMVANGRSAVIAVSGEAGSGKTRLIAESLNDFPSRNVAIFSGVCAPFGETNVWSPIASALFGRAGLDASTPSVTLREVTRAKGVALYGFDADDSTLDHFVEGVMHLLGHPSELDRVPPAQARELLFSFVVEGIRRRTQSGPVVLWMDDLQWANVLIVDLLRRIARSLADRPLLIITAQRDDVELNWPPAVDHPITVRLPLEPLTRSEADELMTAALGPDVKSTLVEQLYERSGGNPLFLTELAEVARLNPDSTGLPGSLRALIAARLDRLDPGPRAALDNAAVLGVSGLVIWLNQFASEFGQDFSIEHVEALEEAGLLEVQDGWWHFRTDLVREVAYQTLTKMVRAQRHAGTAAVMIGNPRMPISQAAHHAASATELVAEIGSVDGVAPNIGEQATQLLDAAARSALEVGAFDQARRTATRALDLDAATPDFARGLLLLRAEAETEQHASDQARADAMDVLEASLAAGDRRHEARARRLLGTIHQRSGNLAEAREELDTSVEIFRELGDDIQLSASLRERGFTEVFGGSLEDADRLLREAEVLSELLDDRRGGAWVRQHQAWVAFLSGDLQLAETRLQVAAEEFAELGDRFGSGWALGLLAYVRFFERRFDEAEEIATEVRAEALELGDRWAPAMMDSLIASIRLWTTNFADADKLSNNALNEFRELGDRFGIVQALAPRVRALVALGRSHEAERGLEEALTLSESFGDLAFPAMAAAGAAVHLGLGDRAVTIAELARDRMLAMGADGSESSVTLALGLCQTGRADEALANLLDVAQETPYSRSVHAVAAAMTGDAKTPLDEAEIVLADPGSTYLDRVLVEIAAASADIANDQVESAAIRLVDARKIADDAGDVVARALAMWASAAFVPDTSPPAIDHLATGWHRIIEGLAAAHDRPLV